jgi:hypothetical protein
MEQLKTDLKKNGDNLSRMGPLTTTGDLVSFLRDTLWPTIEALVDETAEIDGCVEDILHGAEDILQSETAQLFAGLIVGGVALVAELKKRLRPDETKLLAAIGEFEQLAGVAREALEEITVPEAESADGDDETEPDADAPAIAQGAKQ